jgi:hypothetical protein
LEETKAPVADEKIQWYLEEEANNPVDHSSPNGQLNAEKRATRLAKMDPSWRHIGLGKRDMDPTWSMVGLGKRGSADPTWGMVGLGKRSQADPTWSMVGLGKRSGGADPTWALAGLGKRTADPTWGMVGLGKRAASQKLEAEWPQVFTDRRR